MHSNPRGTTRSSSRIKPNNTSRHAKGGIRAEQRSRRDWSQYSTAWARGHENKTNDQGSQPTRDFRNRQWGYETSQKSRLGGAPSGRPHEQFATRHQSLGGQDRTKTTETKWLKLLTQAGLRRWNSKRREFVELVEADETGVRTVEEATTNVSARAEKPPSTATQADKTAW